MFGKVRQIKEERVITGRGPGSGKGPPLPDDNALAILDERVEKPRENPDLGVVIDPSRASSPVVWSSRHKEIVQPAQPISFGHQLLAHVPSPVVALNRAIAVGEVDGAAAALELVDALDLDGYQPFHAARADLLRRLGRRTEARAAYEAAAEAAPNDAVRSHLVDQARLVVGG